MQMISFRSTQWLLVALLTAPLSAQATTDFEFDSEPEPHAPWFTHLGVGVNSDGFEVGTGISWFPHQYIGVGLDIGIPMDTSGFGSVFWSVAGNGMIEVDNDDAVVRVTFTPNVTLRSPRLFTWHTYDMDFHIIGNAGYTLSPGATGSYRARWNYWRAAIGLEARLGRGAFSLQYRRSNFYLYDGFYRYPDALPLTHDDTGTLMATVGYTF